MQPTRRALDQKRGRRYMKFPRRRPAARGTGNRSCASAAKRSRSVRFQRSSSSRSSRVIAGASAARRARPRRARACAPAARACAPRRCRWRPAGRPSPGASWPMRCARSAAWSSTAGFHHGSRRNTWSAAVRLRPVPPALQRDEQHRRAALAPGSASTTRGAIARASRRGARTAMLGVAQLAARRGRAATSTARTRAPCGPRRRASSSVLAQHLELRRALDPRAGRARAPRWQAAWRRRSSASSAWNTLPPAASARRRPRAWRRGSRRRPARSSSSSSTCSTTSVRGGSSGATSRLRRRSTNGRMRARSRAAAPASPAAIGRA